MKIGMLGLTFGYGEYGSGNKGCEALSYGFLEVLNILAKTENTQYEAVLFVPYSFAYLKKLLKFGTKAKEGFLPHRNYSNVTVKIMPYYQVKKYTWITSKVKECEVVFDFTGGDSFTDIYGNNRFDSYSRLKEQVLAYGIPLVLGSQTIGPFKTERILERAKNILEKCEQIFVRDEMSLDYTKSISSRKPILTTDIAFFLPYDETKMMSEKKKIGINVSGLLWSGGYRGSNQFDLKVDYQTYCRNLLMELDQRTDYEIHLVPHAFSEDTTSRDNDLNACQEVHKEFPRTILAPYFKNAIEAKTYIAQMDVFLGARMHATVAAYATGVPVIPFSYSRKFEGLYESLAYKYVIHGKGTSTQKACEDTLKWIEEREKLGEAIHKNRSNLEQKNVVMLQEVGRVLKNLSNGE